MNKQAEDKQNITLALPKRVLKRLKVIAAERETSVSRLLTEALEDIVEREHDYEEARREALAMMERGLLRVGEITWTRDELHER